jgi:hypothetical protein
MEYTEIDLTLDKLRIHSTHTSPSMNSSATSVSTGATDLESDMSEAFNASMDFDRHTMHGDNRHRFEDSDSFLMEDSFALDDGHAVSSDQRIQLQIELEPALEQNKLLRSTALEPVMEPSTSEEDDDENDDVTSADSKSAAQRDPTQKL